ncbi:MAG: hypothetical protein HQ494_12895 [Rhodospirillales bacterium]|nr:hypothetical protein [Rhodospirillales bacterium]
MTTPTEKTPAPEGQFDPSTDLAQLYELATLVTAAKDALSDEMVNRLSSAFSEGIVLLDRLTRNEGLMQLLQVLDRPESQYLLKSLADALGEMSRELATAPPAKGGLFAMMNLASQPGTQEGLRAMSILGQHWNDSLRQMHRDGGKK